MRSVVQLTVYPVKSCGPVDLIESDVEPEGLAGDRRYMLVDGDGRFLTRRTHPLMAGIRFRRGEGGWVCTAPDGSDVALPARMDETETTPLSAVIWRDTVDSVQAPADLNAWFSDRLRLPVRLVQRRSGAIRPISKSYDGGGDPLSFADGFPVLIIGTASLEALNRRLEKPVRMARFRPNIVVETAEPFEEDTWTDISIGPVRLQCTRPCDRCEVVDQDPESGARDPRVLRALADFRRWDGKVWFGMNAVPRSGGRIRVGDSVIAG